MSDTDMFKTTLMGGYDKEDVLAQFRKQEEEHNRKVDELNREIQKRDSRIEELTHRLVIKEEQKEKLEQDIKNKYQKYIDHYDSISRLVVESQIRAEAILGEAKTKSEQIIASAESEAQEKIDSVQSEVDELLSDGKRKYEIVQKELNGIVTLVNEVQRRFMESYREIHHIIDTSPGSLERHPDDFLPGYTAEADEADEDSILVEAKKSMRSIEKQIRRDLDLDDVLDEEDDLTEEDIEAFLKKHGMSK